MTGEAEMDEGDYEEEAAREIMLLTLQMLRHAAEIWHLGDGYGGWVMEIIEAEFHAAGLPACPPPSPKAKRPIARGLRTQVFERDAYRCLHCGGHKALTADHIIPESKGGEATLENLQTLCKSCNSKKGTKDA